MAGQERGSGDGSIVGGHSLDEGGRWDANGPRHQMNGVPLFQPVPRKNVRVTEHPATVYDSLARNFEFFELKNDLLEMTRDQSNMICTMEPLQPTSGFGRVSPHDTLQATVRTQGFGANAFSNENLAHRTQPVDTNQDPR